MFAWPQGHYIRLALGVGIVLFLAQAAWVLVPALTSRDASEAAARLAVIRGDLWTRALTGAARAQGASDRSNLFAAEAVRVAPVNSAAWLYLAKTAPLDGAGKHNVFLKLSFFTGPNDIDVMGPRLYEALTSSALSDEEMQLFVSHDLRLALTQRPQLKTIMMKAYLAAPPQNQTQIKALLRDIDPAFAAGLIP